MLQLEDMSFAKQLRNSVVFMAMVSTGTRSVATCVVLWK